jgi:hypothetical protein
MTNFNSLSYVIQLEAAGVSREQAHVHAQMLHQVYDEEHSQYATKADLQCLSNFLENKISSEIADCKKDITEIKADVASIKISLKYMLWIGGGISTMCASAIGVCVSMFLYSLK